MILLLFVAMFFLPFILGTRLRVDVAVGYAALLFTIPLVPRLTGRFETQFFVLAGAAFLWSLVRVGADLFIDENAFTAIQFLTALNFPFFAMCIFMVVRPRLVPLRERLLMILLAASIIINGISVFQWLAVDHPINTFIFQNYGGALPDSVVNLAPEVLGDISTNSEFLAKIAGRYSSIFGGMYVLGLFDVFVIATSVSALKGQREASTLKSLASTAILAALAGGILSASKSFYLGTIIALAILSVLSVINLQRLVLTLFLALPSLIILQADTSDDSMIKAAFDVIVSGDINGILDSRYSAEGLLGTIETVFASNEILLWGVGVNIGDLYLADNGYLLPIIIGGLPLALITYGAVWLMLKENYRQFRAGNVMAAGFFATHCSYLIAGIGIPAYQLPRVTLLFLVLNIIFLASRLDESCQKLRLPSFSK